MIISDAIIELPTGLLDDILYVMSEYLVTKDAESAAIDVGYSPNEFKGLLLLHTNKVQRSSLMKIARAMAA